MPVLPLHWPLTNSRVVPAAAEVTAVILLRDCGYEADAKSNTPMVQQQVDAAGTTTGERCNAVANETIGIEVQIAGEPGHGADPSPLQYVT